jgi:hypothetical protein
MVDRIAAEDLDSLALHDFRNGRAEFHADPPLDRWPMSGSACAA